MRKSYDVLKREHEEAVIESARHQDKMIRLADSLSKRSIAETYKRALTFLHKGGWINNDLVYIESMERNRNDVRVRVWKLYVNGIISHEYYDLHYPEQFFLANPPIEDVVVLWEFIRRTVREGLTIHDTYKKAKDARSSSSNKA